MVLVIGTMGAMGAMEWPGVQSDGVCSWRRVIVELLCRRLCVLMAGRRDAVMPESTTMAYYIHAIYTP